jgi:hypothetical protein
MSGFEFVDPRRASPLAKILRLFVWGSEKGDGTSFPDRDFLITTRAAASKLKNYLTNSSPDFLDRTVI